MANFNLEEKTPPSFQSLTMPHGNSTLASSQPSLEASIRESGSHGLSVSEPYTHDENALKAAELLMGLGDPVTEQTLSSLGEEINERVMQYERNKMIMIEKKASILFPMLLGP